ncbi:MAG TPA: A24 family peptidase [Firmicutes bacterium]|nr:A24 family peptidase [Bacillota bacterium]
MLELISALLGALIIAAAAILGYRGAVASVINAKSRSDSGKEDNLSANDKQVSQSGSDKQNNQSASDKQNNQSASDKQDIQSVSDKLNSSSDSTDLKKRALTGQTVLAPAAAVESSAGGKLTRFGLPVSMIVMTILTCAVWILSSFLHGYELWRLISNLCLSVFLTILAAVDLEYKRVPNRVLLVMLVVYALVAGIYIITDISNGLASIFVSAAGSLFAGVSFLLCYIISRRQLGGGDVKLAFLLGLYLGGGRIFSAIIYGILCCFIYSVVQLCRRRLGLRDGVPLVPFLYLGTLITFIIVG